VGPRTSRLPPSIPRPGKMERAEGTQNPPSIRNCRPSGLYPCHAPQTDRTRYSCSRTTADNRTAAAAS
jgi:hypothetical protein